MKSAMPLSAFLLLAGIAFASEGPVLQQGSAAEGEIVKGAPVVNTITAFEGDLKRRISALEAEITAGGDEETLQLRIIELKTQGELQRLELLVQECLASGRTEEAALAQGELDRRRTVQPAIEQPNRQVLTLEEKRAIGGTDQPMPARRITPATTSTTEGGR